MNKQLENLKVLVTGGAGFIGSNLCEFLTDSGAFVRCLDNFSTGKKDNIKDLISNKNFELIEGDITDLDTCIEACDNIDYVLHHAALGSVPRSVKNPILTNLVNISGFLNMLVASKNQNVKRFIYAASSSTYGDSKELPKIEDNIGSPLSPYAITKYVNELYALNFNKLYNIDTIGLRYFNVFGEKQDPDGPYAAVIPKFINSFLNFESPIINGDGFHSRDFTYIDNVIQINVLAILTSNKNALNQIYNVACGQRTNLNQLVEGIRENLKDYNYKLKNLKVINGKERDGDVLHSLASIEKAKTLLNYYPKFDFKKGLKKTISWYLKKNESKKKS
tara:strand:- start:1759 stop:2760 length:1002 start_codon:yes stop_codon:yes gene_type:complete